MRESRLSRHFASIVFAGIVAVAALGAPAGGWAQTAGTAPAPGVQPRQTVPEARDPGTSGSSSESLSERLDRSGGVIRPPSGVDPGADRAPPAVSPQSTPVIPPPGTPGSDKPEVKPK